VQPDWEEIDDAFEQATNLVGEARHAYLGRLSPDLRREVESLLAADASSTAVVSGLVGEAAASFRNSLEPLKEVGPWRLVKPLAEGGMGSVFLAEREGEGFRQTAALKLLRIGMSSRFFVSRFRQERRIVAALDHPNIARLLDGGAAPDGRPYLVLEYVDGQAITRFSESLPVAGRIRVFLDVCRAVEHAHQRMVIHRDLKPSNILVTREGQVKLLDFGIAKILDPEAAGETVAVTGAEVKLMTPEYASPEQVRGEAITTATDVYCLGLVLFELLTGRKPLQLPTRAPLEAARIVCEQEPGSTGLAPDLDAVIRKCLRKEPEARYPGVAGLREDLECVLRGDPVKAYQGAWTYRAAKWVRRYRWGAAAAALVLLAVLGGVIATAREARIAQRRYEEVRQLARTVIFDVYDQVEMLPAATKARETIVNTALRYLEGLRADAGNDTGLAMELAAAYLKVGDVLGNPWAANLGREGEAEAAFQKAKTLYASVGAKEARRPGVRRGMAQALFRLAQLADSHHQLSEVRRLVAEAEAAELAEPSDDLHRDWPLLTNLDYLKIRLDGNLADGRRLGEDLRALKYHATRWYEIRPEAESRYWAMFSGEYQSESYAGEPTRAVESLRGVILRMEREAAEAGAHIWVRHDVEYYWATLSTLYSGLRYPPVGDPAAAVRTVGRWREAAARYHLRDINDNRQSVETLFHRVEFLPALSQVDPAGGWREFEDVREVLRRLEAAGKAGAFDPGDYGQLAVGGVRALRRLGRKEEAIAEAKSGIQGIARGGPDVRSPFICHIENVLRFELALLGVDRQEAVEVARALRERWPASLLLQADAVKILTVSGARRDAAKILEAMPACEYRRRLEREFKKSDFLD
jgi:hypothetical protein